MISINEDIVAVAVVIFGRQHVELTTITIVATAFVKSTSFLLL